MLNELLEHLEHLEHLAHLARTIEPRFTDRELQVPRFPRISCRELRLHQLYVVLFQENHIQWSRGARRSRNPGTLGMTARKAFGRIGYTTRLIENISTKLTSYRSKQLLPRVASLQTARSSASSRRGGWRSRSRNKCARLPTITTR
jgi:hypothetical protein